jgi:hypothetical protein
MQRITDDNQRLLKRIQETPSAYNHLEWEEDARRLDAFKRTMSLFPEFYDKAENEKMKSRTGSRRASTSLIPIATTKRDTPSPETYRTSFPKI